MAAFALAMRVRPAVDRIWLQGSLISALLLALVGAELAVLVVWLPETVEMWWRADRTGDFGSFYAAAKGLEVNGLYSPGLSVLMHPLAYLGTATAYRVYVGLGALALLAVAYLAQRSVELPEGRLAVALGVLSVPQMHWALRLGHLTPFLALAALSGFLLLRRHPVLAGLCFAVLILKPQYAPVPALYLLWTRNGRAFAAMAAGVLGIELLGFGVTGFGAIGQYLSSFFDWGADARDNLLPHQQAWQYAWQGFLISGGHDPRPLVIFDLLLFSLAVVVLVWVRGGRSVAMPAVALGMLLVTPYANFYDWGLLVVAGALLLRANIRWKPLLPVIVVGLYAALLVSQQATPFPAVEFDLSAVGTGGHFFITPAEISVTTKGLYWVTPAALAVVVFLVLMAKEDKDEGGTISGGKGPSNRAAEAPAIETSVIRRNGPATAVRLALAGALIPIAYFAAAYEWGSPPFDEPYDPFSRSSVMSELPSDFPRPPSGKLESAGPGVQLPYRVEWVSSKPVSEVASVYRKLLDEEAWELMLDEESLPSYRVRLARFTSYGFMTHWAMLAVTPQGDGSRISLDFYVTQRFTFTSGSGATAPQ